MDMDILTTPSCDLGEGCSKIDNSTLLVYEFPFNQTRGTGCVNPCLQHGEPQTMIHGDSHISH